MKKLSIEQQLNFTGGSQTASCLGGILAGSLAGAGVGLKYGKYVPGLGTGWGILVGFVGGGLIGAYTSGCFD